MVQLQEVAIAATRASSAAHEQPFTIRQVDRRNLRQRLSRNLPEAMADLPGVLVQKTANGHGSPFVRGFTGYRVLTLIDGVRYNNSVYRDGPNEYVSLIDHFTIDHLALIGGPASSLYGSDAVGGVVSLHTRGATFDVADAGEPWFAARQHLRYAHAERSGQANVEFEWGRAQRWGALLSATGRDYGDLHAAGLGEQQHTGYTEHGTHFRFDRKLARDWHLAALHQQLAQDDVWRTHSTIFADSFAGTEVGDDLRRLKDQYRDLSYLKLVRERPGAPVERVALTISQQRWDEDGDRIRANGSRIREGFNSRMRGIDLQVDRWLPRGLLIVGLDYYVDRVDSARRDYAPDGSLDQIAVQGPVGDDARYAQGGIFAQYTHDLSDTAQLQFGSRFHYTRADVGRFADPQTGLPRAFDEHWTGLVSSLRLYRSLNREWAVWGGVSQAFRAPNLADISRSGRSRSSETEVAALGLDPERFLTYEVGLKQASQRGTTSLAVFYTDIDDFIASTPTGREIDGLTEVSKRNAANGAVRGVEASVERWVTGTWLVSGSVTWQRGELDSFDSLTSPNGEREPMSRIMPLTLVAALRWQPRTDRWLELSLRRARRADRLSPGDAADTQRIPPGGTPAYTVVNLRGGCTFTDRAELTVGLENLFDEAYRAHGSGVNEPGFGITAGLSLAW